MTISRICNQFVKDCNTLGDALINGETDKKVGEAFCRFIVFIAAGVYIVCLPTTCIAALTGGAILPLACNIILLGGSIYILNKLQPKSYIERAQEAINKVFEKYESVFE